MGGNHDFAHLSGELKNDIIESVINDKNYGYQYDHN